MPQAPAAAQGRRVVLLLACLPMQQAHACCTHCACLRTRVVASTLDTAHARAHTAALVQTSAALLKELARHVELLQRGNDSLHETVSKLRQQSSIAAACNGVEPAGGVMTSAATAGAAGEVDRCAQAQLDAIQACSDGGQCRTGWPVLDEAASRSVESYNVAFARSTHTG